MLLADENALALRLVMAAGDDHLAWKRRNLSAVHRLDNAKALVREALAIVEAEQGRSLQGADGSGAALFPLLDKRQDHAILVGVGDLSPMKGAFSMGCGCGKKTPAAPAKKPNKPSDKK